MTLLLSLLLLIPILLFLSVHAGEVDEVFEIGREYNIRPADLKAIAYIETEWTFDPLWDEGNGREYGLYCINIKLHKLTKAQAQNPEAATRWVCRYLNKKGYQRDRERAIRRFNGRGHNARKYARIVLKKSGEYERNMKRGVREIEKGG